MKRKGGQSDLRPSRYGSTSSTSFRPRVRVLDGNVAPVDFGAEQDNLFEPIGESVIASQAGKYDNDFIGAFGNVKSTAPIQPVINSGEHQATTSNQSEVYQSGGVDTYAPANEDEDDEELMDIFGKLGVSDDYGKYFSGDKAGKGMNMGYTY